MSQLMPTSKYDLKMQCIAVSKGDMKQAQEMYDFIASDIKLPDFTPPRPTAMQQIKETAGGLFGWIKDNQDDITRFYNIIQSVRGGSPIADTSVQVSSELPPLPPIE